MGSTMTIVLPQSPTISIGEAAAILGVSRRTGYRMAETGDLPIIDLGANRARRVPTQVFLAKFSLI